MSVPVKDLAMSIGGSVLGDGDATVSELKSIEEASERALCPLFRKRLLALAPVMPTAVAAGRVLAEFAVAKGVRSAIVCEAPKLALSRLIDIFYPPQEQRGHMDGRAAVHDTASVHPTAEIGAFAVVEAGVRIGAGSVIGPGAVICRDTVIGERVLIGPGAVIGHEGFGFLPTLDGPVKVRQVGRVVIEDDVEIGANTCIDRGALGTTHIGRRTKMDNLVQVGHNARVGEAVIMAGQVGIAGSSEIGERAMLGGQAGVADHLIVGAGARVAAKSGVTRNVKAGETVAGYPAMELRKWRRAMAGLARAHGGTAEEEDE